MSSIYIVCMHYVCMYVYMYIYTQQKKKVDTYSS